MSQDTRYICDGCKKPIGEKPHLSFIVHQGQPTGVALPPGHCNGVENQWHVCRNITENFLHFHDGDCIKRWADKLIADAVKKKP